MNLFAHFTTVLIINYIKLSCSTKNSSIKKTYERKKIRKLLTHWRSLRFFFEGKLDRNTTYELSPTPLLIFNSI